MNSLSESAHRLSLITTSQCDIRWTISKKNFSSISWQHFTIKYHDVNTANFRDQGLYAPEASI